MVHNFEIYIASDHAGYDLKSDLIQYLSHKNYVVKDLGAHSTQSVDYPDISENLTKQLKSNKNSIGILICGSGVGISIAANRKPYIRAALCHNKEYAELSRKHNDANVLVLGARMVSLNSAKEILDSFLATEFEGGRHQLRVEKLSNIVGE